MVRPVASFTAATFSAAPFLVVPFAILLLSAHSISLPTLTVLSLDLEPSVWPAKEVSTVHGSDQGSVLSGSMCVSI